MLLIALIGAAASVAVGFLAARTASGLGRNLRSAVFKKVSSFSNHEMDHFTTASLITRSTNDITQIQNLTVMMIRMLFYAPILGVGGVIRAVEKSTSMSWIIAVAVLCDDIGFPYFFLNRKIEMYYIAVIGDLFR